MLTHKDIIKNARDPDEFTVNFSTIIKEIFKNTVQIKEAIDINDYKSDIIMIDKNEINRPIKFIYFLLLKQKLINENGKGIIISSELSKIMRDNDILMNYTVNSFFNEEISKNE